MGTLDLKGPLNLAGTLTLKDTLTISGKKALVQVDKTGTAPPVILPPPPATPLDEGQDVSIIASFNQTVKAGSNAIVALGMVMQGTHPRKTWPGMMLPSSANTGPGKVTINNLAINVEGDQAVIFPSGGSATFNTSGQ